jgi:hypothetical protein
MYPKSGSSVTCSWTHSSQGGGADCVVTLDYGYGFERYGAYEDCRSGWDVTLNGRKLLRWSDKTYDLPKSFLIAERELGIVAKGDPAVCRYHASNPYFANVFTKYSRNFQRFKVSAYHTIKIQSVEELIVAMTTISLTVSASKTSYVGTTAPI